MENKVTEPQGISFFNVKSGDTHYLKNEPGIAAYINSSDMGINASRDQDFGWKLGKEWVEKVRQFRRDRVQMQLLAKEHGGAKPSTVQILYFIYSEELAAYEEEVEENENPFEEQYRQDIAEKASPKAPVVEDEITEDVDEDYLFPGEKPEDEEGTPDANPSTPTSSAPSATEPSQEVSTTSDSNESVDTAKEPSTSKTPKPTASKK